jgi:hypothetical protein
MLHWQNLAGQSLLANKQQTVVSPHAQRQYHIMGVEFPRRQARHSEISFDLGMKLLAHSVVSIVGERDSLPTPRGVLYTPLTRNIRHH